MSVRTAYAGTALSGDVYTAANHARMPGGWIGYAQVTADQAFLNADLGGLETDVTGLSVTVTVGTSRRIRVTGHGMITLDDALGNPAGLGFIKEGATYLGRWAAFDLNAAAGQIFDRATLMFEGGVVLTPTTGAHTYKLTFACQAGADMLLDASATNPAWILVEDLGPAT